MMPRFNYKLKGYYTDPNYPSIISNFLIENIDTGGTFKASVLEAKQLYNIGKLDIDIDDNAYTFNKKKLYH